MQNAVFRATLWCYDEEVEGRGIQRAVTPGGRRALSDKHWLLWTHRYPPRSANVALWSSPCLLYKCCWQDRAAPVRHWALGGSSMFSPRTFSISYFRCFLGPRQRMNSRSCKEYSQDSCRDWVSSLFSLIPIFLPHYELPLPPTPRLVYCFLWSNRLSWRQELREGMIRSCVSTPRGTKVTEKCVWQKLHLLHLSSILLGKSF